MRRFVTLGVVMGISLLSTGCLAVVSSKTIRAKQRQAVVVDGEVYIVDLSGRRAVKVDPNIMASAEIVDQTDDTSERD